MLAQAAASASTTLCTACESCLRPSAWLLLFACAAICYNNNNCAPAAGDPPQPSGHCVQNRLGGTSSCFYAYKTDVSWHGNGKTARNADVAFCSKPTLQFSAAGWFMRSLHWQVSLQVTQVVYLTFVLGNLTGGVLATHWQPAQNHDAVCRQLSKRMRRAGQ